ncbi:lysoplasmalogenase family protein [Streptomyces sp. NPDC056503]|uniref:lysoplasmalogenase family protein n=1 Tax=Streptomyces sp. NPDC056503 TaxID=3345842 RepID=UPI0036AEC91B
MTARGTCSVRPAGRRRRRSDTAPLLALFTALAAVDITGVVLDVPVLEWATKPLLAPVLALYVRRITGTRHPAFLTGLGFAAAGDVALLFPGPVAFATGIALFLGAQLCWTTAFVRAGAVPHLRRRPLLCCAYLAVWCAAVLALAPALEPGLAVGLSFYGLVLVTMACAAHVKGARAAWGGAVFLVSDMLIGLGAAGVDLPGRSLLVMPTYVVALALLATAFTTGREDRAPLDGPFVAAGDTADPVGIRAPRSSPVRARARATVTAWRRVRPARRRVRPGP